MSKLNNPAISYSFPCIPRLLFVTGLTFWLGMFWIVFIIHPDLIRRLSSRIGRANIGRPPLRYGLFGKTLREVFTAKM